MKLIVGLGNPGAEYERTRHNIGFIVLEALAAHFGASWRMKDKFKAWAAETEIDGQKTILLKPTTFYNLSGEAVRAIKDFYKISHKDILIIHDELALPFGTLRRRPDGSDAGNNGIKNVTDHIGPDYARLRIGIANEYLERMNAQDFVLNNFSTDERLHFDEIIKHTTEAAKQFLDGDFTAHTVRTKE